MTNAVQSYIDEDGRKILYGYADEISAQPNEVIEEWREDKRRREAIARGPVRNYVNSYHNPVESLNGVLDVSDLGAIMKLIPYIKMNANGALHIDGKQMNIAGMAKALDRSVVQTRRIASKLSDAGVLIPRKEGRTNVYSIEERYHSIGYAKKGEEFTKVLQLKTRTDIRNLSLQAAGVLYKMLPFFNYTHFYLTDNPNEVDASKLRYISHRQFAEMTNTNRNTMNEGLRELRRHGFVMLSDAFGNQLYRVNPDIMTRRRDNHTSDVDAIRNEFAALRDNAEQNGLDELPF